MAIEDTFAFLNTEEFGTTCQIGGGSNFVGILDSPMDVIAGGVALSREYLLMAKTSDVSSAARGTSILLHLRRTPSGKIALLMTACFLSFC